MLKDKTYEEFKKWKNQKFLNEMFVEDEGDIVSEEDLIYDDSKENKEE